MHQCPQANARAIAAAQPHTGEMENEHDIVETMTIDDLAILMANGFAELKGDLRNEFKSGIYGLREEFNARFMALERKVDALQSDISGLVFDGKKLKHRTENLEIQSFGSIQTA
jgi:hypothetical protein